MEDKTAVGVAEFTKLTSAIVFIDTAVKAADVHFIGCELTGSGLVSMKLQGNVAAVQAAMDAGIATAAAFGGAFGHTVLARPHEETERMLRGRTSVYIRAPETADQKPQDKAPELEPLAPEAAKVETKAPVQAVSAVIEDPAPESTMPEEAKSDDRPAEGKAPEQILPEEEPQTEERRPTCNLCGDINCPRTKYQPHKECIHHMEGGTNA